MAYLAAVKAIINDLEGRAWGLLIIAECIYNKYLIGMFYTPPTHCITYTCIFTKVIVGFFRVDYLSRIDAFLLYGKSKEHKFY